MHHGADTFWQLLVITLSMPLLLTLCEKGCEFSMLVMGLCM